MEQNSSAFYLFASHKDNDMSGIWKPNEKHT